MSSDDYLGSSILRLRMGIIKAIKYRKNQPGSFQSRIESLKLDIENSISHVFGEHSGCATYFCAGTNEEGKSNLYPDLRESALFDKLMMIVKHLSRNSRSLLYDVDNNPVEQFNSIVAKMIGGKRVNFALHRSYQGRCAGAAIRHNTKNLAYKTSRKMFSSSPGLFCKNMERRRLKKLQFSTSRKQGKPRCRKSLYKDAFGGDSAYGPNAQRPDMSADEYNEAERDFLTTLPVLEEDRIRIERATIMQGESGEWREIRRELLTASFFGKVCNMRANTSCKNLVKQIIYCSMDYKACAYGREKEILAKAEIRERFGWNIVDCGLFIDREHPYFAASPDGLIGNDGLLEIKCPYSARHLTPDEAIESKKNNILVN